MSRSVIDLARWALVTLGLIYLVTEAAIVTPVRVVIARIHPLLATLVYCGACSGFWLGLMTSPFWGSHWFLAPLGAMALGATWSAWHGNPAWDAEAPLREPPDPSPPTTST